MRRAAAAACLAALPSVAADLYPVALHVFGQPRLYSNGWNLVEGRELWSPQGVAADLGSSPPHLYVADTGNHRVLGWREASGFANGASADLVLGQPDRFGAAPNSPSVAQGLNQPSGLAVDRAGNLYVADTANHRVLRYPRPFDAQVPAPDFVIGQPNFNLRDRNQLLPDPSDASLSAPQSVAVTPSGDLLVADTGNNRVLLFSAAALRSPLPSAALRLDQIPNPVALALDPAGRLYVASAITNRVYQFPANLTPGVSPLRILGGNGDTTRRGPGALLRPSGVAFLGDDLFIADTANHRVLRYRGLARSLDPRPSADLVFGQPDFSSGLPNGGSTRLPLPSSTSLAYPAHLAPGPGGGLLVADSGNHRVLLLSVDLREASRILGQDDFTRAGPNRLEGRELSTFHTLLTSLGSLPAVGGLAVDPTSSPPHAYVADTTNHRVLGWRDLRSLREGRSPDLVFGQPDLCTAIANYGAPAAENRPASPSNLNRPSGLALDRDGNLYVADTGNHRVLRFPRPFDETAPGLPRADLVLGHPSGGVTAYLMNQPTGLAIHPSRGDLLVADTLNHRVLYFPAPLRSGMSATRVFGQTSFVEAARGVSSSSLTLPTGVAFDADDYVYIADTGNSRVLVFGPLRDLPSAGSAALATGAAPLGQPDFVTSGGATAPNRLRNPTALAVDPGSGDIWVADTNNHRVLRFPPLAALALNNMTPYPAGGLLGQINFTARNPNLGAPAVGQTSPAGLSFPNALALDPAGNLLAGDANARLLLYYPQAVSVSAATFLPAAPLAPGMLASLFGSGLARETASAASLPLSVTLADTQVLVEDAPVPLLYVSPGQINYQAPSWLEPGSIARVQVIAASTGRVLAGGSFLVAPAAVGVFGVLNADGAPNSPASPAARGSVLQIFATGQGAVRNPPPDGAPAPSSPLAETPVRPLVTIGTSSERDVVPDFSGLAPGFVGLWQINARIPEATVPAPRVPLAIRYGGSAGNVVYIAVR